MKHPKDPYAKLEHVIYEVSRLLRAYRMQPKSQHGINNRLELVAIHARAMNDFFGPKKKTGDVVASQFDGYVLVETGHAKGAPIIPAELRKRINKEIAHLDYSRIEGAPSEKSWDLDAMVIPLMAQCEAFFQHVADKASTKALLDKITLRRLREIRVAVSAFNEAQELIEKLLPSVGSKRPVSGLD
jgi:hypothetical protein